MPGWYRLSRLVDAPKSKGDGRKPRQEGKTKKQARADVIARHAERKVERNVHPSEETHRRR